MNAATVATNAGDLQTSAGCAVESKSSETQTMTTQTTQTPAGAAAAAAAVSSASSDQQAATASSLQSITQRTSQQPLALPNATQQQQQQQPVYSHQYPPAFQQPLYGSGQSNYYNQMQQGAIPRTYPQQQQQQQYHGMHPQQSQTLNRSGYPYGAMTQQPNYAADFGGTLPPQMQYGNRSDAGVSSYHHPHPASIHPHHHHQQQQQQQQHHHHHPYYDRAYSVQGDVSNDVLMQDMMNQTRRSISGRPPHHHSGHPHHLNRRDLLSSKSVDYSGMDGPPNAAAGSSNGFFQDDHDQLMRAARRHRSRSTENVVGNELGNPVMAGLGSDVLKRMLQPVQQMPGQMVVGLSPNASPLTSPEMSRRGTSSHRPISDGFQSEPEISSSRTPRFYAPLARPIGANPKMAMSRTMSYGSARVSSSVGAAVQQQHAHQQPQQRSQSFASDSMRQNVERNLYLDFDGRGDAGSPSSDNILFDHHLCYATTPSSSNGNSDMEGNNPLPPPPPMAVGSAGMGSATGARSNNATQQGPVATSPTSRLLLEYEMHLRNTLAKGMDAESCSLHTFEALLSQSMEDLESIIRAKGNGYSSSSSSTPRVAQPQRRLLSEVERIQEKYRGGRGLIGAPPPGPPSVPSSSRSADRSSRLSRSETAPTNANHHHHAQQQGSEANRSSYYGVGGAADLERSLYSERDRGYLSDMSSRANSFYERQDSVRSGYLSDRETVAGATNRLGGPAAALSGSSGNIVVQQQTSIESTDSRLCYLTSSEMSDDDRLSLTTAISDDDDGGGGCGESEGQHHGHQSGTTSPFRKSGAAASFNCTGAVRKAGFLSVKKWLLRKKHQVELARKRGWRGYWVCLKGTTLLFYPCDSREGRHVEAAPKHLIIVDGAIMQPIPEHPQRDFIFCLSTAFGDAYLFQAPCQAELDTWVNSIHSACAAAFARHRGKTGTLHLLQEEILRLERSIESDHKLKHMAELQLSVVSESESRRQIGAQIAAWEENLERLHCEQFRLRCYMASLQHGELPNPKSLLTHVSRSTKHTLNRLGVFTVSSFHAYICARSPSLLNNLLAGRGATRRRAVAAPTLSRSNSLSSRKSQSVAAASSQHSGHHHEGDRQFRVNLPDGQTATVNLKDNMTVEEFLASACGKRGLNPAEHFVRVKKRRDMDNSNHFVPHRTDLIDSYVPSHELVEICGKALYQVELSRNNLEQMWGFSVEAELVENTERQDELCVFVSRVEDRSVAMNHGIIKGDEIMVINGALVGDLDMMYIESVLQEELSLSLMIRSCRADPPDVTCLLRTTDDLIDSLVCPPPPSDQLITDDVLSNLIVPAPSWHGQSAQTVDSPGAFPTELPPIQQHKSSPADVVGPVLRPRMSERSSTSTTSDFRRSSPTGSIASSQSIALTPNRQLSDGEKLKKCILELVETERTYVKHLNNLLENYLEPLKQETFLSSAEINALFGNIQEIVTFQRMFQQSLEEALAVEPHFELIDQPYQFKNVLFAIGSAFLQHANHFKLYSSFCASHSKAQKVLLPNEGSQALQEFLQSRNPRQQHSSTLESYLIKPIQRILKYPLLLQQLRNLTDPNSSEHQHLVDALKGMEKVAEHINEMQRIHEEYGAIFDHLFRQHQKSCKQPVDLSPSELLYYGGVEWLNISDFLGKVKKGLELHAMCFVFKTAVVFLCKERLRQRKKLMSVTTKTSAPEVEIIRYQVLIPVTEVQVRTAQAKDMEAHYLWELIHLKNPLHRRSEKVYHLSNSTAEFRNAFLKTIRQIIRESVRNMSIPPAKPPVPSASTPPTPKAEADKSKGKRNVQRHSAGTIDYDNVEACGGGEAEDIPTVTFRGRSNTIGEKKSIRRVDSSEARDGDPGVKSENEDDHQHRSKPSLGRTPNHLSLSTTSTLSTGSACSQAKLIQASRTPQSYAPAAAKPLGSPIWKPREGVGESFTLPRPSKSNDMPNSGSNSGNKNSYGTLGNPSKK
ncbi:protein still life, isoform SIF type 1-like isoform X3 [Daphnia carinata]|uniref:protein still life, isoform SIF type 1-like isoform X3 n=1 Tax=Daphnia carinata TaxID=120202 RepID=UPI0028687258|nr:protein still life, isoform SIF type 1-like isoform X3 [Daphnia carinata]